MAKKEWTQESVNQRLAAGSVKARVFKRSDGLLYLQATLPPKPGSDRPRPYQQKIYLHVPANEEGYRRAEDEARLLGGQLAAKTFDWAMWLDVQKLPDGKPNRVWIEEFERQYMATHNLQVGTWLGDWWKVYKRLPPDEPLTVELLEALVEKTGKDSRNRMETCKKLQHLANYAGLDIDLLRFKGVYGAAKVQDRGELPDELIAQVWSRIPNPRWQWFYGMMAACGLRDHEVFFCEWRDDGLQVLKGKTGSRLVFQPLYPEWVEQWNLRDVRMPLVRNVDETYERRKLGDKAAKQFRRYGVPFPPYALRHAFGIRASVTFELPVTTAAALMGHTPDIHLKRYHKHISLKQNQSAAQRVMSRADRPIAPDV